MAKIRGLFFDQDGVIIDTERDGHRVAFNETFKKFGFDFQWDVETYYELLKVSGGKERMRHYLHNAGFGVEIKPEDEDQLIKDMHKYKTETFIEMIEGGELPLRPGVQRMMQEANQAGLALGICTTSNQRSAHAIAYGVLSDIEFDFVLAGDIVEHKKPAPDVYNLALEKSGLKPEQCVVIEDSHNGIQAAHAAGMHIVATTNPYTEHEDLSQADIIVTCLGDPEGEHGALKKCDGSLAYHGVLHVHQIMDFFEG